MSHGPYRLDKGGRIDRTRVVTFQFNGRELQGFAGDTLASALLANGVQVIARSFKYHRPRGIVAAGPEEPNALMGVEHEGRVTPVIQATMQALLPGMMVTTERGFPGLGLDLLRVLDFTHALWPAGFYNKTFMWPGWHSWEWMIRRLAGHGRLPPVPGTERSYHHTLHCDVLVCGGGKSGIAEALEAARTGQRVVLVEQEARLGGQALSEQGNDRGIPAWLESAQEELARSDRVTVLRSTTVLGFHDHKLVTAVDRSDLAAHGVQRYWKLRAAEVVLATGATEQPLVFPDNDRPGVMLAGAVRRYLQDFGVCIGRRVVIATNNDEPYRLAQELKRAGATVPMIVDTRAQVPAALVEECERAGIALCHPAFVSGTRGAKGITYVVVQHATTGEPINIACDAVAMSGGFNAATQLLTQAGGTLNWDSSSASFRAGVVPAGVRVVGLARGSEIAVGPRWSSALQGRQWLDFAHDVCVSDIQLAVSEGIDSVEHLKRHTTAGMALDQGRTSAINVLTVFAELTSRDPAELGTTTARAPVSPVDLRVLAGSRRGALYAAERRTPADAWHRQHGGVMQDYGGWRRAAWYARAGESREAAIEREVLAVRRGVGLFDGSPLGKIEVKGPDAGRFLDFIYASSMTSLAVGRLRYSLMLNDNGIIIDDGVLARLSEDHYLVGTTSGQAGRIAAWLEAWHQREWPTLDLVIAPVTSQWGVVTIAGPQARDLLLQVTTDMDFSAEAFVHMSLKTGQVDGHAARIQRVSYTGELSFEVSVAANAMPALWEKLVTAGASVGVTAIGLEAWLILRMEKGYLHVGTDTDGTTNPFDVGFRKALQRKTGDYIGRRSLGRTHDQDANRRQLVGLQLVGESSQWRAGAQLVTTTGARRSEGVVTSACHSPSLGGAIALGMLERGQQRMGEVVTLFDEGRTCQARVVSPVFYDPEGRCFHA